MDNVWVVVDYMCLGTTLIDLDDWSTEACGYFSVYNIRTRIDPDRYRMYYGDEYTFDRHWQVCVKCRGYIKHVIEHRKQQALARA